MAWIAVVCHCMELYVRPINYRFPQLQAVRVRGRPDVSSRDMCVTSQSEYAHSSAAVNRYCNDNALLVSWARK